MSMIKNPVHPGEVLQELYMASLGLSAGGLAKRLDVPRTRIERLVKGETALSADTAIRLSAYFTNTAEFWLNLQRAYDLAEAAKQVDVSHIRPMEAA
jgi:addiction module HigA family antidote